MSSPTYLLNQAANRVGGAGCSRQTSYARRRSSHGERCSGFVRRPVSTQMTLACALSLAAESPSELEVDAPAGLVEAYGLERLIDVVMYLAALAPARKRMTDLI